MSRTFRSQSSQDSLRSSVGPSKRRLLRRDLSSNLISFFDTLFGSISIFALIFEFDDGGVEMF